MNEKKKKNKIEELEVKIFEAEDENDEDIIINYGSVNPCSECC